MSKKYDLICSLGGNCSAAHNLKIRGLRNFSLPFDWCYIKNEKPIEYLTEGFENGFKNFLLKKNLEELKGNEYNEAHISCAQYKDSYTGYYFVNHFRKFERLKKFHRICLAYTWQKTRDISKMGYVSCGLHILSL